MASTRTLAIQLLKPHVRQESDYLKPDPAVVPHSVVVDGGPTYSLFVIASLPRSPKWTDFFEGYLDLGIFGRTSSTGAVLVLPVADRIMAVTFGTRGRYMLRDDCYEERFGLKVVLNSIGEGRLRSIDKHTFDAIPKHTREQTSRDAAPFEFSLDVERDLLRAVTGALEDVTLGRMLTGMDALRASVEVDLITLPEFLGAYLVRFFSDSYKERFPWVDKIADVRDRDTHDLLDLLLMDTIARHDFARCWLAAPDIVDWFSVSGFKYSKGISAPVHNDIHLDTFLQTLAGPPSLALFAQRNIYCTGDDGEIKASWPAYRCLYCEIDYGGESYLLSGGKWYQVARDFRDEVNNSFNRLQFIDLRWPEYDDDSEGAYLRRVQAQQPSQFALMDQKFIFHGPIRSKIEFCDIFTRTNDLIHVKRYGNAGGLSHLFSQGLVSADLLLVDSEFREKVRDRLPIIYKEQIPTSRPSPDRFRVVYAIISQSQSTLSLPFFSRLSLKHAVHRLEGLGYQVMLSKIAVSEERKRLQQIRQRNNRQRRRSNRQQS